MEILRKMHRIHYNTGKDRLQHEEWRAVADKGDEGAGRPRPHLVWGLQI